MTVLPISIKKKKSHLHCLSFPRLKIPTSIYHSSPDMVFKAFNSLVALFWIQSILFGLFATVEKYHSINNPNESLFALEIFLSTSIWVSVCLLNTEFTILQTKVLNSHCWEAFRVSSFFIMPYFLCGTLHVGIEKSPLRIMQTPT